MNETKCSKCVFETKYDGEFTCHFENRLNLLCENGALVDLDKRGHHIIRNRECCFYKDREGKKISKKKLAQLEGEAINQEFTWNIFLVDFDDSLKSGAEYVKHVLGDIDNRVKSVVLVTDNINKYLDEMTSLIALDNRFSLVDVGVADNKIFNFNVALNSTLKKVLSDYYLIIEEELDMTDGYIDYIIDTVTEKVNFGCRRLAATRSKEEGFGVFNTSVHFAIGGLMQMNDTELVNFLTEGGKLPKACMPSWEEFDD